MSSQSPSKFSRQGSIESSGSTNYGKRGVKQSQYTLRSAKSNKTSYDKELQITRKINELFKERDQKQNQVILNTMMLNNLVVYKTYRKAFEQKFHDLEKDRVKISRSKKSRKDKTKLFMKNSVEKLHTICVILKKTYLHFQRLYFESDHYRVLKLEEIQHGISDNVNYQVLDTDFMEGKQAILEQKKKQSDPIRKQIFKRVDSSIKKKNLVPKKKIKDKNDVLDVLSDSFKESVQIQKRYLNYQTQLVGFFDSPYADDRKFVIQHIAELSREKSTNSISTVDKLFYDRVFNVLIQDNEKNEQDDEVNKHKAFEVLINLMDQSPAQRLKLKKENYLKRVFEMSNLTKKSSNNKQTTVTMKRQRVSEKRIIEKLAHLVSIIAFHQDEMNDCIVDLQLLDFIIDITKNFKDHPNICQQGVLALSLLTDNESLFEDILKKDVIDLILEICREKDQIIEIKLYSTLCLVHFALNKKSIKMLIDKGVMELFQSFRISNFDFSIKDDEDHQSNIQTNISWIFLALCNNGITGKQMLEQGITRDMFLVACNQELQQIRHIVITGFAELGRYNHAEKIFENQQQQRIKETAIFSMHEYFEKQPQQTIDLLLQFSASLDLKYRYTAVQSLKDYILLNYQNLIDDIGDIVKSFLCGCQLDQENEEIYTKIQTECSNALAFMVMTKLVYKNEDMKFDDEMLAKRIQEIEQEPVDHIIDGIMNLSGADSTYIRSIAFSTLSSLSTFASQSKTIMAKIKRDTSIPNQESSSSHYNDFISKRIEQESEKFKNKFRKDQNEKTYSGLFSLLRLAQEPTQDQIQECLNLFIEFIQKSKMMKEEDKQPCQHFLRNEKYFMDVFLALKHCQDEDIIMKLLKVIRFYINENDSPCQQDIINPDTVLYLLEIIENNSSKKLLSSLSSMTLLKIVNNHLIPIDYQEVAIIQKFNKVLQHIEVFEKDDCIQEEQSGESSRDKQSLSSENMDKSERELLKLKNDEDKSASSMKDSEKSQNKKFMKQIRKLHAQKSESYREIQLSKKEKEIVEKQKLEKVKRISSMMAINLKKNNTTQAQNSNTSQSDLTHRRQSTLKRKVTVLGRAKNQGLLEFNKLKTKSKTPQQSPLHSPSDRSEQSDDSLTDSLDSMSEKSHEDSLPDVEDLDMIMSQVDRTTGTQKIEMYLRDSIVKAFMVIFTNEQNQHLLTNKDLIDIAFNCLEVSTDITLDAQKNVSRLVSLVFMFPSVQERLINEGDQVINGLCNLINMIGKKSSNFKHFNIKEDNKRQRKLSKRLDVLKHLLQSSKILSYNTHFINHPFLSLKILKSLCTIVQTKLITNLLETKDLHNLLQSITNLIQGPKQNKEYFKSCGITKVYLQKLSEEVDEEQAINQQDLISKKICLELFINLSAEKNILQNVLIEDDHVSQLLQGIKTCINISKSYQIDRYKQVKQTQQKTFSKVMVLTPEQQIELYQNKAIRKTESNKRKTLHENQLYMIEIRAKVWLLCSKIIQLKQQQQQLDDFLPILGDDLSYVLKQQENIIETTINLKQFEDEINNRKEFILSSIIRYLKFQAKNRTYQKFLLFDICIFEYIQNVKMANKLLILHVLQSFIQDFELDECSFVEHCLSQRKELLKKLISSILQLTQSESSQESSVFDSISLSQQTDDDLCILETVLWITQTLIEQTVSEDLVNILYENNLLKIIEHAIKKNQKHKMITINCLNILKLILETSNIQNTSLETIFELIHQQEFVQDKDVDEILLQCLNKYNQRIMGKSSDRSVIQFNIFLLQLALEVEYKPKKDSADEICENDFEIDSQLSFDQALGDIDVECLDQDEDEENSDCVQVENAVTALQVLIKNSCQNQDLEMITELIDNGLLKMCQKYIGLYEDLEILNYNYKSIKLIKAIQNILISLAHLVYYNIDSIMYLHKLVYEHQLIKIFKMTRKFIDYEIQTNYYSGIRAFLLVNDDVYQLTEYQMQLKLEIQINAIKSNLYNELEESLENPINGWYKIKRICQELKYDINEKEPELYKLNSLSVPSP